MELTFLIKYIPFLAKLLGQQASVTVKVEIAKETKYILKIKNNSKYNIVINGLIAKPSVLAKNNSWTSLNDSKFFKNKPLPPGESIDFIFYPKDIKDLCQIFIFKAEYEVLMLFNKIKMKKTSSEIIFCPRDYTVKIGSTLSQKY